MRARLDLEPVGGKTTIPWNWQYFLSSAIYSTFEQSDPQLANYLHRSKEIKLYTFSQIRAPNRNPTDKGLTVFDEAELIFSTAKDLIMKTGVEGALVKGRLRVKDAEFRIKSVEMMEQPDFSKAADEYIKGKTLSPVNTSTKRKKEGKLKQWDLYPDDIQFYENIRKNLLKKYEKIHGEKPEDRFLDLKINRFDNKRVNIRDTHHRASHFNFNIKGSPKLIETAYQCGLGEKNSMGFGCIQFNDI